MNSEITDLYWQAIIEEVLESDHALVLKKVDDFGQSIPLIEDSHLFRRSIGEPHGQNKDWRANIIGTVEGVHVREYPSFYQVHVDKHDPMKDPVGHIVYDSPGTLMSISAILTLIGIFFHWRKRHRM